MTRSRGVLILVLSLFAIYCGVAAADDNERITKREFREKGLRCGTRIVYEDEARVIEALSRQWKQDYGFLMHSQAVPNIKVYFHVLRSDTTINGGNIPDSWINAQMAELNSHF